MAVVREGIFAINGKYTPDNPPSPLSTAFKNVHKSHQRFINFPLPSPFFFSRSPSLNRNLKRLIIRVMGLFTLPPHVVIVFVAAIAESTKVVVGSDVGPAGRKSPHDAIQNADHSRKGRRIPRRFLFTLYLHPRV